MPWKDDYTISDERSTPVGSIRWPNEARCCVKIVVNLSLAAGPEGVRSADLCSGDALFAMGEGLNALLDTLDRHSFKATFAVPAVIAQIYPQKIRELVARGHEVAAQGLKNEDVSNLLRDEESRRLEITTKILTEVAGRRPVGWFSLPRVGDQYAVGSVSGGTMDLLIDSGYEYMGNGLADDIPHYWVTDFGSSRSILVLPYYYHFDDQYFMLFPRRGSGLENPDFILRNWKAEFNAQYRRGRLFEMTLHPQNVGWGHRMRNLHQFMGYVGEFPDLWNGTSEQCAEHWKQVYPASMALRLEPSIWQDHPGSLS